MNSANSPAAMAMPTVVPIAEATTPTIAASRMTLDEHLAAGSAERAQQRELAGALGHRDREGVEDDERADEQGDAPEREQDRLEDVDEPAVALLGREAVGLRRLDVERHGRAEVRGLQVLRRAAPGVTPVSAAIWMRSTWPGAIEDLARGPRA